MAKKTQSRSPAFIRDAISTAGKGAPKNIRVFAEALLDGLGKDDFEGMTTDDVAHLVTSGWDFIVNRPPKRHNLKIISPGAQRGVLRNFTIIEVLNADMPFLVDSVMGEIQERGYRVHLVLHPMLRVTRDAKRHIATINGAAGRAPDGAVRESYIQVHIPRIGKAQADELAAALERILTDVRTVVDDWRPMLGRLDSAIAAYTTAPPSVPVADLAESIQFLKWLLDNNFTFLGMRAFRFVGGKSRGELKPVSGTGLGILRDPKVSVLRKGRETMHMTPEIRKFFLAPAPLIVTKSNMRSTVHRRAYMDYIGVKIYGEKGELSGELRIVGLFTSTAYTRATRNIPFLRQKVEVVLNRSGYPPDSHSGKALLNVLETFPRDELFQIGVDQLYETATGIQSLDLRPRARAFARVDEFDRFVSIIVFVPRDRFSTGVRLAIGEFLAETYNGRVSAFYPFFPEGPLVRIHFIIGRSEGKTPSRSQSFLDENVERIVHTWEDMLDEELTAGGDVTGKELSTKYRGAFSTAYQAAFAPERAVREIAQFEALDDASPVAVDFYRDKGDRDDRVRVALYHRHGAIPLSRRVPVLENMGFSVIDERSYRIELSDGTTMALHDMALEHPQAGALDEDMTDARCESCFLAVWRGIAGSDAFNKLVLSAGLDWREAAALRAYGAFLRQIGAPFGQAYLAETLLRHTDIARTLVDMFCRLFDPSTGDTPEKRRASIKPFIARIEEALDAIPSLDEDRIIRHYLNLVQVTVRTNFYQKAPDGGPLPAISFKFDSRKVDGSPSPRPFAEIFVFCPEVEGIHLRGGPIARGGLRWSDRAQDFRTEVLGLAKAQQVKNVVIVPTGSKGGFVPKYLFRASGRDEFMEIGIAAYRLFIRNLLLLTDNLKGKKVIPPKDTVRFDGDDPYLVVAADKGTATFSDFANEISVGHDFWLGDAFASGGSAGYDHKKMGITARGGWEAVKRHFRELDWDIQNVPFRVIGVGDMSGDVFGNGMLLSKATKLIAAFDHRDIFIDPDPDPAASWKERQRLFKMGRSSWQDYNPKLIGKGGGVFSRSAKSIRLSAEIREITGLAENEVTPSTLIRALLKSRFDLLWFGGIGTYAGGANESDEQIGDRATDAIRVKARELDVKVIGEGANLGMTQLARIEFALAGGCVNTDAIDNSAGVNSSDLEVNIKIALGAAVIAGKLTIEKRNVFLARMTEEVAAACLENNYLQTLAISLGIRRGVADIGFQQRLMRDLEGSGQLDREIEFLPDDMEIEERRAQGQGLTRPELAVLLAYAKIDLHDELINSKVPDEPYFERELEGYFPPMLRQHYPDEIASHRLRRNVIATRLSNVVINRGGSTMSVRLKEETGRGAADVVLAFSAAQAVFGLEDIFKRIDALDNKVAGLAQLDLYLRVQDVVRAQTSWFLRHVSLGADLSGIIEHYREGLSKIASGLRSTLSDAAKADMKGDLDHLAEVGVPMPLAKSLAEIRFLANAPDIVLAADTIKLPVGEIAGVFHDVGGFFRIGELRQLGEQLLLTDYFDRLAVNSAVNATFDAQRSLVQAIARLTPGKKASFKGWHDANPLSTARTKRALDDILDGGDPSLSRLMVAVGHLRALSSA